jgi:metallophosphoesterase (TIGR03768 family)
MKITNKISVYPLIFIGLILLLNSSCRKEKPANTKPGKTLTSNVQTTIDRTIIPDYAPFPALIYPYEISKYTLYGYGTWQYGPGLAVQKRLDIMPAGYNSLSVTKAANLLSFFTMTDIHLCDKETPAQAIIAGYKGGNVAGYSADMLLTTQVLNAAVRTINALHKQNSFDFGMSLGDDCNNTQYNELRWFIDVLDGKYINPDSGHKDDPIPGPNNDYQDPYQAEGLNKAIPWYQVLGNHDHFWCGSYPANDYIRQSYTGMYIVNQANPQTGDLDARGFYNGSVDGRTPYGDIIGVGDTSNFLTPPQVLAADANRRSLWRDEWMNEFFNTTSTPVGHGFSQSNVSTGFACYSFEPKADIPIKVIVLDDTQENGNPDNGGYAHSFLDNDRFNWLINELDKGQAENKLMIIAAHIPIGLGPGLWDVTAPITEEQLITQLHMYSNLILWVSGHRHLNVVTVQPSPDPTHPELGFWEVETSSLKDFPQMFRTFNIARNTDNTISIFATNVDPIAEPGSLVALSRSYSVASYQLFNYQVQYAPSGAYNAELVKQLSPEMQIIIQNYGIAVK